MTPDRDHDALVQVLDRAIDSVSPRDPDPVGAVVRRARARRRRVVASACVLALGVAGAGLAGALATGQGTGRTTAAAAPDPIGQVRDVVPWSGRTVEFEGLTIPVPDGWVVRHASGSPLIGCHAPSGGALWLLDAPATPDRGPACDYPDENPVVWVAADYQRREKVLVGDGMEFDPSGQPVWMPFEPIGQQLTFPWLGVRVGYSGSPREPLHRLLSSIQAAPVAPHPGLHLPDRIGTVSFELFGADRKRSSIPDGYQTVRPGAQLDAVTRVLRGARPDDQLRCVPAAVAVAQLGDQSQPYAPRWTEINFDTTGACHQVTDNLGGLATLDDAGLRQLRELVGLPD